jgi:hypothetical protein
LFSTESARVELAASAVELALTVRVVAGGDGGAVLDDV